MFPLATEDDFATKFANHWTTPLLRCCGSQTCARDFSQSLEVGCFCFGCYYCMLGRIAQRLERMPGVAMTEDEMEACTDGCIAPCAMELNFCTGSLFAFEIRKGVATRYSIGDEDECTSCVKQCFCPSCSVLQMLREMAAHGEYPGTCCLDMDGPGQQPPMPSSIGASSSSPLPPPSGAANPNARAPAWNAAAAAAGPSTAAAPAPPFMFPGAAGFYPSVAAQPAFAPVYGVSHQQHQQPSSHATVYPNPNE